MWNYFFTWLAIITGTYGVLEEVYGERYEPGDYCGIPCDR